ncbi:hypothetical protein GCM10027089_58780 [Nocardia thraciensis]
MFGAPRTFNAYRQALSIGIPFARSTRDIAAASHSDVPNADVRKPAKPCSPQMFRTRPLFG